MQAGTVRPAPSHRRLGPSPVEDTDGNAERSKGAQGRSGRRGQDADGRGNGLHRERIPRPLRGGAGRAAHSARRRRRRLQDLQEHAGPARHRRRRVPAAVGVPERTERTDLRAGRHQRRGQGPAGLLPGQPPPGDQGRAGRRVAALPGDLAALADLPPREVLLARLAGALAAPMQQMAGLLQALPRNMAYGISALIEERQAAGETLPAEPEPTPPSPPKPRPRPQPPPRRRGAGRARGRGRSPQKRPPPRSRWRPPGRRRRSRTRRAPPKRHPSSPRSHFRTAPHRTNKTEAKKGRPGRWQP